MFRSHEPIHFWTSLVYLWRSSALIKLSVLAGLVAIGISITTAESTGAGLSALLLEVGVGLFLILPIVLTSLVIEERQSGAYRSESRSAQRIRLRRIRRSGHVVAHAENFEKSGWKLKYLQKALKALPGKTDSLFFVFKLDSSIVVVRVLLEGSPRISIGMPEDEIVVDFDQAAWFEHYVDAIQDSYQVGVRTNPDLLIKPIADAIVSLARDPVVTHSSETIHGIVLWEGSEGDAQTAGIVEGGQAWIGDEQIAVAEFHYQAIRSDEPFTHGGDQARIAAEACRIWKRLHPDEHRPPVA